ncbi:MAG: autotransporter outer membrane beta-barrel domain-containing protein [Puniceicoccales bacterium]|jgi:outer membrane autotransporter protein|nr:autotransporter outer membrane beta-barrel domain-containing protein [Puniceicoccales bacterium]
MKNFKTMLCLFALVVAPLLSFGIAFRNPFFENVRVFRENANAMGDSIICYADSILNEPDAKAKHIWLSSGHVNHCQTEELGLGYSADTFLVNVGADLKYSSLFSFLDRSIMGLFASYADTSLDYKGSESLKGDKTKQNSLTFGFYSGYGLKRFTIFSSSLFATTKYNNRLSVHSEDNLSGPLKNVEPHTFRGRSTHSNLGISYKCPCKRLTIEPMAFLNYETIMQKKHDDGTISVERQRASYLQATLGIKLEVSTSIGSRKAKPHLFVGLARDLYSRDKLSKTVRDPQGNQVVQTLFKRERNSVKIGAGLSILLKDTIAADVAYQGEYSKHNKASAILVGISCKF